MNRASGAAESRYYQAYGLNIASCISCPELSPGREEPDVHIRYGAVPDYLPDAIAKGVRYQAAPGRFLLIVDRIAKYLVSDGREIVVERSQNALDAELRLFLLGSVMGALLHQRGHLVIHGSAIEVQGSAVVFTGPSGNGKSTLAGAFHRRGYRVLADDVCLISSVEDGPVMAVPSYPQLALWKDATKRLVEKPKSMRRVRPKLEKLGLDISQGFVQRPLPLRSVYVLDTTNTKEFELKQLKGSEKITALIDNTYRVHYLEGLDMKIPHFKQCAAAAKQALIKRLARPIKPFLLDELVELLEEDFSG